jgi:antitoxin VapB
MNAHSPLRLEKKAAIFKSNRNQAVRIPKDLAFPDDVKEVYILKIGKRLEIIPVGSLWDDFFDRGPNPDFPEREQPPHQERDFDF